MEANIVEEAAVAVPTKVALTGNPLIVAGVTVAVLGVVGTLAYRKYRKSKALKDETAEATVATS